jgi:hypothetical protein
MHMRAHLPFDGVQRVKAHVDKDGALAQEGQRLKGAQRGRALLPAACMHKKLHLIVFPLFPCCLPCCSRLQSCLK